jgi:nitrous oxidase accessory protein NosD
VPVSPSFSHLLVKEKRAATAALLLVLFVAVLPFFFSGGVSASIAHQSGSILINELTSVNMDGSNHPSIAAANGSVVSSESVVSRVSVSSSNNLTIDNQTSQDVTSTVQTSLSVKIQPSRIALGNNVSVKVVVSPPPPTADDFFGNLTVLILRPDGTVDLLEPFSTDPTGSFSVSYTPEMIGSYTVKAIYGGQFFANRNMTYLGAESSETTLTVSSYATSKIWIVDDDGPADFRSIQEAINVAQDGDRIQVMDGSYFENLSIDKPITLQGVNPKLTTLYGGIIIETSGIVVDSLRLVGPGKWDRLHTYSYGVQTLSNQSLSLGQRQDVWGTVVSNCVFDNWVIPIFLGGGDGSKIVNNTIFNSDEGIDLDTFDNNISNNKINVGGWGISIGDEYVSGNHLFGNQISGGLGIEINWFNRNNTVEGNTISGCRYGIHLGAYSEGYGPCSENLIFHNNFLNNVQQVFLGSGSADVWDNGYLLGGNYWSDYRGIDANKDGSGDTPYVIDSKNVDRYPLMSIWNLTSAEQVANG